MEKHEKVASFPCRGRKNLLIYSWYSLSDLKHDQKRLLRIPSLNVPEMRLSGTFWSILSNGYHGNDDCLKNFNDRLKNFNFSFGYVFPSSMTVQSFLTIKWQEKKLSVIKVFKFFVSDHLKLMYILCAGVGIPVTFPLQNNYTTLLLG